MVIEISLLEGQNIQNEELSVEDKAITTDLTVKEVDLKLILQKGLLLFLKSEIYRAFSIVVSKEL